MSIKILINGIGPKGLTVMGEVTLPVHAGSRITNVNFIIANTAEGTEVTLFCSSPTWTMAAER